MSKYKVSTAFEKSIYIIVFFISFNRHNNQSIVYVSKYVGVTNILKYIIPLYSMYILYNTIIPPHLNYGILLWGHASTKLHRLQTQAVRTINISKYNEHTEPLFILCTICSIINYTIKSNENLYHPTFIM